MRAEWLVAASVVFASAGQLTLKRGLAADALSFHGLPVLLLVGLLTYALGTLLWTQAVARDEISYLYPLSAINYVLVAVGGSVLLGEGVHWDRWAGIVVMTAGIGVLLHSSKGERE